MMEHAIRLTELAIDNRPVNSYLNQNLPIGNPPNGLACSEDWTSGTEWTGNIVLAGLHPRLNVVVSSHAPTRQRIRNFLKSGLADSVSREEFRMNETGNLSLQQGGRSARFQATVGGCFFSSPPAGEKFTSPETRFSPLVTPVQREIFEGLLDVDCDSQLESNSPEALALAAGTFVRHFVSPGVPAIWNSHAEYLRWTVQARDRRSRLETLSSELKQTEQQQQQLLASLEEQRGLAESRRQAEQEIAATHHTVLHLTGCLTRLEDERDRLNREIATLEAGIQSQSVNLRPVGLAPLVRLSGLLERIDEIDLQLQAWEVFQSNIQEERLKLREESSRAASLSLESEAHPYHRVGEFLAQLDSAVAQTSAECHHTVLDENKRPLHAIRFADHAAAHTFASETAERCEGMRADLRGVCEELENQYRHVRHRSTVAEMKQLRRCFDDVTANRARMTERRQQLMDEVRELDPKLAAAISRVEADFFQLLRREGLQAARARFVEDSTFSPEAVSALYVHPATVTESGRDVSALRTRLGELVLKRQNVIQEWNLTRDQLAAARERLQQQTTMLDRYRQVDLAGQENQLAALTRQIAAKRPELESLRLQVEDDSRRPAWTPSPELVMASGLLEKISGGDFTAFHSTGVPVAGTSLQTLAGTAALPWNSTAAPGLTIVNRLGNEIALAGITADARRDCRISLALAAQRLMAGQQGALPLLLTVTGNSLADPWLQRMTRLVEQQGLAGLQMILLCDRNPVLSSRSGIERNDLLRIYELQNPPVAESNARIVSWQPVAGPNVVCPAVYNDLSDIRPIQQPTHRFSSSLGSLRQQRSESPGRGSEALPPIETSISEDTLLRNVRVCSGSLQAHLEVARIFTIADLLELDPFDLPSTISLQMVQPEELDRIQAAAWLMVCVPGLSTVDAQLLVNCGMLEPEQLESTQADQLVARISRFFAGSNGNGNGMSPQEIAGRYSRERIDRWYRSLDSTRSRWRQSNGYSRRLRRLPARKMPNPSENENFQTGYFATERKQAWRPGDSYFADQERTRPSIWRSPEPDSEREAASSRNSARYVRPDRESRDEPHDGDEHYRIPRDEPRRDREANRDRQPRSFEPRDPENHEPRDTSRGHEPGEFATRQRTMPADRDPVQRNDRQRDSERARVARPAAHTSGLPDGLKFYLNLDDPVEAAPSIGPRTAERFEKIGIHTIRDFLRTTAESMAEKIDYKRIDETVIRQWQDQSRLVCRVPNLRGHDAQLLVACGVTEPERLETMSAGQLMSLVGPFSDTKEGLKIIRSGKKPDLDEVADWIRWSKHTRSLNAA